MGQEPGSGMSREAGSGMSREPGTTPRERVEQIKTYVRDHVDERLDLEDVYKRQVCAYAAGTILYRDIEAILSHAGLIYF